MKSLALEIINGKRLSKDDDLKFLSTCNLDELCEGADLIRQNLCGNQVDLCTIINGKSGKCSENCKFCAQSSHYNTNIEVYDFLDSKIILDDCKKNQLKGVHRYSIVTAGKDLTNNDFKKAVNIYKKLKNECSINLCASHGFLTEEQLIILKNAGVTMYHTNIETSKNNFSNICTTHSFEDKINLIKTVKKSGLKICSGGIIGMGESFKDRIHMALTLSELKVDSIPINVLMPIKGTPLENSVRLNKEEILRTIASFRYINPNSYIRMAAGRSYFKDGGKKIFLSGANATITGDMLTTVGNNTAQDKIMLRELGFCI